MTSIMKNLDFHALKIVLFYDGYNGGSVSVDVS